MTQSEPSISAGVLETELVHIHLGQCGDSLGPVDQALTSFAGGSGTSATVVNVTFESLTDGNRAINLHQAGKPGIFTPGGNIPASIEGSRISV